EIDARGGALAAIETGYVQNEIQKALYAYQRAVESGDEVIVGVNKFTVEEEEHVDILTVDPAIEAAQRARLAALRARRDNERVSALRDRLVQAARGTDNLMPIILECVENDVTLGEICHSLRGVFGEYRPPVTL
ncbi:MAG: methylmalonyl-CoA mutase family protein, partial [Anaerolinea sp.]|nr:methylmalonyl-CoA mutase family protein [Anaerolinea sp.]